MKSSNDPFDVVLVEEDADAFEALSQKSVSQREPELPSLPAAITGRLADFDLNDRPLVGGIPNHPQELVPARTTVALRREEVGATVVLVFEQGDSRRPIILGVVRDAAPAVGVERSAPAPVSVRVDDDRINLSAEREIVLRCGEASITLTRAGKVLISGKYLLSRSSGYNKIKGAAVDIN